MKNDAPSTNGKHDVADGEPTGVVEGHLMHGRGAFGFADGSVFEGAWAYGRMNGTGEYRYARGMKYTGVPGQQARGKGVMIWPDEAV